jgi:hypothetical protein
MHFAFQERGYVNMHILSHAFFRIHLSLKENTYSVGDTKFYMTYAYTIQHAFIILPLEMHVCFGDSLRGARLQTCKLRQRRSASLLSVTLE